MLGVGVGTVIVRWKEGLECTVGVIREILHRGSFIRIVERRERDFKLRCQLITTN
jgi:hypothetical protein